MKEYNPDIDLALVIANTKRKPGTRVKDIITIAKAIERLVKYYGSKEKLGKVVDLSSEMIREFLTALKLPKEVQKMIEKRKIDKIDVVRKIATFTEAPEQMNAAEVFATLSSDEARDILRLVKTTGVSIEEAKRVILEAKPKGFHIFMIDFDDEIYRALLELSKKHNIKPAELVRNIIIDWLKQDKEKHPKD